ncbi:MAG TPA: hypothetical protein P5534_08185 [Candidatus Paceibacterota bacterium]|nr:hypothetical protein [Candidatus Paceibacterota bacterium]HRZ55910.1 hypothetical protein [Candidatus Paceibacterota bacterium]
MTNTVYLTQKYRWEVHMQINCRFFFRFWTLAVLGVASSLSTFAIAFTDGFEGATLNPFWTSKAQSGSISLGSTMVYAGSQSLQLQSYYYSGQKDIRLFHTFEQAMYGTFSVMVYDTGADQNSGNYLQFYIKNAADDAAVLWVNDYDWGPSNGGNWYYSVYDEGEVRDTVDGVLGNASSQVDRERRWFNLEIEALADSLTLLVLKQACLGQLLHRPG